MDASAGSRKKLKSPGVEGVINAKTSITCTNVPEGLFDAAAAKKHFSKFGRVQKIRLFPKRHMCIIEYDQPMSVERAMLNAGAFDGFMFDVTRYKARMRKRSRKEDDPDWVPDSDVEEELLAMRGGPTPRVTRQKPMEEDLLIKTPTKIVRVAKASPLRKKSVIAVKTPVMPQPTTVSGIESPVLVMTTQTSLNTTEAAAELHQLRSKISLTPDEQWRTLDARDRILRAWGGAGSRMKVGGATIGTCAHMCPEKELLHRQAEYQVLTLETMLDSDGQLDPFRAVKQYSRSSADQEIPMCYELRPAPVLMRTCSYLLREIADNTRHVSMADWFHFMWDRLRGIRKDITQQALCCSESIQLVEMCARFHAHCAARLADLEHTQFDQKLNTDNLTKCLQTLKHMYADVGPEKKPNEAEFRGYIALLNLGDANFWWEIKQLPQSIQKSKDIIFAIKIFNAIDNNNYVRFFRLVKNEATYLQACILLRYFNDVRARALARMVKAFAPRGGSRFPADELMNVLAFESVESMRSFVNNYGLRFGKTDDIELTVVLDRNQFIEDSDPYPVARAMKLIETKQHNSVGEVISGGTLHKLPCFEFDKCGLHTSFNNDGRLKESSLIAEDQNYNTINDSNKDIQALKTEIQRLAQGTRIVGNVERFPESTPNILIKSAVKSTVETISKINESKLPPTFHFTPAIPVAPIEAIKNSPEKTFSDTKNIFSFSKPENSGVQNLFSNKGSVNLFKSSTIKSVVDSKSNSDTNIFNKADKDTQNIFRGTTAKENVFKKPDIMKSVFSQPLKNIDQSVKDEIVNNNNKTVFGNVFGNKAFTTTKGDEDSRKKIFSQNTTGFNFAKPQVAKEASLFKEHDSIKPSNIFNTFAKPQNIFSLPKKIMNNSDNKDDISKPNSIFGSPNGNALSSKITPGDLFKSVNNQANTAEFKSNSIFMSKSKISSVAENVNLQKDSSIYDFNENCEDSQKSFEIQYLQREKIRQVEEENRRKEQEEARKKEQEESQKKEKEEARRKEEEVRKKLEEERRKEELKLIEEKRKKQEEKELKRLQEIEQKKKEAEERKKYIERVDKESLELIDGLIKEINDETVNIHMKEECELLKALLSHADAVSDEILSEMCNEICCLEMKAVKFRNEKLERKWFYVWRKHIMRNMKRQSFLEDTPVWLSDKTPVEEANYLRRGIEKSALKNMNAIHRGYKFTGALNQFPLPDPYNIMEIIKSPLLKRMKQINYPYDKSFFWKVTLVSPGSSKWLCKKINIEKWLLDVFGDKKVHEVSQSLIHVGKQSWNNLMDFAISVSLTNMYDSSNINEALGGTKGLLFYAIESDDLIRSIQEILKHKYPYQLMPIAIVMPQNDTMHKELSLFLTNLIENKSIASYRIFVLENQGIFESLNKTSKRALRWIAKNYPQNPPIEIDLLKSICQRYLGNEIWCKLRLKADYRMPTILKDLKRLVNCYNTVVDKLTAVLTNEDLFNYPSFPLEFTPYLDSAMPYPKSFEFVPSNVRTSENIAAIKGMMSQLKLPNPVTNFHPNSVVAMQENIRKYCNQIGWFDNPEEVVCKVVALMPNELSDVSLSQETFCKYFEQYDLAHFLNIIVYEKICRLSNFDNRYAIYEKSVLHEYRNIHWLHGTDILQSVKHKAIEYEDDLDWLIESKRRKINSDSFEYLALEDNDCSLVEDMIKSTDKSILDINNCKDTVEQLEKDLEIESMKSMQLENLLKAALADV